MESKKVPGLYFAGEIINVDGITGGFNFQHAWTSGWIAAASMEEQDFSDLMDWQDGLVWILGDEVYQT